MIITMHLYTGLFVYGDAIAQMRTLLAMPKGREGFFRIDLILVPGEGVAASLLMSRKTLYIDAFLGADGTWYHFADSKPPFASGLGVGGNNNRLRKIALDGTHSALRTNTTATTYSAFTRMDLAALRQYSGGNFDHLRLPLSFAVVACAEAVRFKETELRIERLLASEHDAYKPLGDWQTLFKNWEKLTEVQSAKVWVRHAG
ncbi:ribosome-inactivating family protein [Pseudomonas putida]|uniref:ribosome-inactivating family protein n=1 Tax=Pseudomonas putida TaxID=303 RepID=UPI00383BAC78